eukprot:6613104-Karenia_brevis.AAC.1
MEQVEAEADPEPLRSESMDAQVDEPRLVDTETADAFHRLEDRDKIRLTCRRCNYENHPGTN